MMRRLVNTVLLITLVGPCCWPVLVLNVVRLAEEITVM